MGSQDINQKKEGTSALLSIQDQDWYKQFSDKIVLCTVVYEAGNKNFWNLS